MCASVCMYVCIYMCMYVCVYIYVCMYVCVYVCVYACMLVYRDESCFFLGAETLNIPMRLFSLNRERLVQSLRECDGVPENAIVVLQGGEQQTRYCSDTDIVFRQVSSLSH